MWDTVSVNGPRGPQKAPDQRNSKKEIKSKLYVWSSSVSNYKHQCNCVFLRQSQALKYPQSVVTLGKLPLKSQTVCACVPTGIQPPTNGDKIHCKSWRCCSDWSFLHYDGKFLLGFSWYELLIYRPWYHSNAVAFTAIRLKGVDLDLEKTKGAQKQLTRHSIKTLHEFPWFTQRSNHIFVDL